MIAIKGIAIRSPSFAWLLVGSVVGSVVVGGGAPTPVTIPPFAFAD